MEFVTSLIIQRWHEKSSKSHLNFHFQVFWNSRLNTVHAKTVSQFDENSVVFDIFSGIGPFVLPAVKTKNVIKAYANDLNPSAIDFLKQNAKLNKASF